MHPTAIGCIHSDTLNADTHNAKAVSAIRLDGRCDTQARIRALEVHTHVDRMFSCDPQQCVLVLAGDNPPARGSASSPSPKATVIDPNCARRRSIRPVRFGPPDTVR